MLLREIEKERTLLKEVKEQVNFWWEVAGALYPSFLDMKKPEVDLNVKGRCAGKAFLQRNKVSFNKILLEENFEEFCGRTIPHEVAHIVSYVVHKEGGHGFGWRRVMKAFGLESSRCHNYDVTNSTVRTIEAKFRYICNCNEYMFTKIRHTRSERSIQRLGKGHYICRRCRTALKYEPLKYAAEEKIKKQKEKSMKTRELQRMAKELNKVVSPSPPINLDADRDTLNNEVEEVTGMLAKGDKIPQWLMDKIKDAEFNLPKGVGVEGETKVHTKKDIDNKIVSDKKKENNK